MSRNVLVSIKAIGALLVLIAGLIGCGNETATTPEEWGEAFCQARLDSSVGDPEGIAAYAAALEAIPPPPGLDPSVTDAYDALLVRLHDGYPTNPVHQGSWIGLVANSVDDVIYAADDEIPTMTPGFLGSASKPEETACAELQSENEREL